MFVVHPEKLRDLWKPVDICTSEDADSITTYSPTKVCEAFVNSFDAKPLIRKVGNWYCGIVVHAHCESQMHDWAMEAADGIMSDLTEDELSDANIRNISRGCAKAAAFQFGTNCAWSKNPSVLEMALLLTLDDQDADVWFDAEDEAKLWFGELPKNPSARAIIRCLQSAIQEELDEHCFGFSRMHEAAMSLMVGNSDSDYGHAMGKVLAGLHDDNDW